MFQGVVEGGGWGVGGGGGEDCIMYTRLDNTPSIRFANNGPTIDIRCCSDV